MSNVLRVRISERKRDGEPIFEGTVEIPGVRPTKLVKSRDGTDTVYTSRSSLTQSVQAFAKKMGFSDIDFGNNTVNSSTATTKNTKKSKKKGMSSAAASNCSSICM